MKIVAVLVIAAFLQQTPLQKAAAAFTAAEALESELQKKPESERTREAYIRVIDAYQRVYLITPHTGYADNALITIARLYEEIRESRAAIRTLTFLLREYPGTPFRDAAQRHLARLENAPPPKTTATSPSGTSAIDNVRYWEAPDSIRVVVDVSGEVTFKQGEAKSPDRVFIDITPARLSSALTSKEWPVQSGLLKQIRVGQYDGTTVRVVLDVGSIGRVSSFNLREPDRIVIDVIGLGARALTSERETAAVAVPVVAPPALPPVAAAESKPVPEPASTAVVTPAKPTDRGNHSLIRSLGLKLTRVVIDAGHGGHDTGSIGPSGYTEKELVLDVAQRLKKQIETELGASVVMTRSDDTFIPLEARTALANQHQADLFISIHANASRTRSVRGIETFFLNFTTSKETLETVARENAASEKSIHELQDLVKKIMLQDKVDESRELARHVQKALVGKRGAPYDRGVKQAPFVVLIGANMPSILAEICFISNPQEEKRIKDPQHRQLIAESLFQGVRSYAESLSGLKTAKAQDKN